MIRDLDGEIMTMDEVLEALAGGAAFGLVLASAWAAIWIVAGAL